MNNGPSVVAGPSENLYISATFTEAIEVTVNPNIKRRILCIRIFLYVTSFGSFDFNFPDISRFLFIRPSARLSREKFHFSYANDVTAISQASAT